MSAKRYIEVVERLKKIASIKLPSEDERDVEEVLAECFDLNEVFDNGQIEGQVTLARNILTELGIEY